MSTVIKVENISKQYRLGQVGTGSLVHDVNRTWHRIRGKEDPYLKIGEANDRSTKGSSDYVWALQDINFEVQQGEVLGIIGRNGAGKSTLLKILSRTTTPTTGSVKIRGRVASLLEVGTGFHPDLSGRENIFLNGAILGMTRQEIKNKFDEIVDFAGVERYIDTPVKRYSSGMYVRLAFGVAAYLEPEILIVDEVLAVGDAEFQKKALGKMKDVSNKEGRTVIFVSHNMAAVENLCDTGIVLNNGKIYFKSSALSAIQSYLSLSKKNATEDAILFRKDRQGNGVLKFSKVELLDANSKKEMSVITSGQNVILRLFVIITMEIRIDKLEIAVGLNDKFDNRIVHISNNLTDQNYEAREGQLQFIDININRLPFTAGGYSLTLFISINDTIADWVENAFYFVVENGDFYKTGKTVPTTAGLFLLNHEFSFHKK